MKKGLMRVGMCRDVNQVLCVDPRSSENLLGRVYYIVSTFVFVACSSQNRIGRAD